MALNNLSIELTNVLDLGFPNKCFVSVRSGQLRESQVRLYEVVLIYKCDILK